MKAHFVVQSISVVHLEIEKERKKAKKREKNKEKRRKNRDKRERNEKKRKIAEILFIFYALLSF